MASADQPTSPDEDLTGEGGIEGTEPALEGTPVRGRIVDFLSGEGIDEAVIQITAEGAARPWRRTVTRPGEGGRFSLLAPAGSPLHVIATADRHARGEWRQEIDPPTNGPEGRPREIDLGSFPLAPESVIRVLIDDSALPPGESNHRLITLDSRGTLRDPMAADLIAVECRCLETLAPEALGDAGASRRAGESIDGAVTFSGLAAGRYHLGFRRGGWRLGEMEVEIATAEEKTVEFRVEPPLHLTGSVLENGTPKGPGSLMVWGEGSRGRAEIAADGSFLIDLPAPGNYSFTLLAADHGPGQMGITLMRWIGAPGDVVLEFETARLSVEVVGPDGAGFGGLTGMLLGPQSYPFATDPEGRFEIEGVVHGRYRWIFHRSVPGAFSPGGELEIDGDAEVVYRFLATVELEVRVLWGEEREEREKPPWAYHLGEHGVLTGLKRGSEEGRWLWPRQAGIGVVLARGWAPAFFEVTRPSSPSPVEVALMPGGELEVTIRGDGNRSLPGHAFHVEAVEAPALPAEWGRRRTGSRGSLRLSLAPGTYRVRTTLPGAGESVADVVIEANKVATLRIP
ncbi:MAG: hypothetical protein ACE5GW_01700 [Planctomycetota bacterium]